MKRYKPTGEGSGGKREGAGKSKGTINKFSRMAIAEASKTGGLPHVLLAQWAQTGVMRRVAMEEYWELEPVKPETMQAKNNKGEAVVEPRKGHVATRPVIEDGKYVYEDYFLSAAEQILCADKSANYLAPKLVSSVVAKESQTGEYASKVDAEFVMRKLMAPAKPKPGEYKEIAPPKDDDPKPTMN